jgi:hypothetical protein
MGLGRDLFCFSNLNWETNWYGNKVTDLPRCKDKNKDLNCAEYKKLWYKFWIKNTKQSKI